MMANVVTDIVIRARDRASGVLKRLRTSIGALTKSFKGMNAVLGAGLAFISARQIPRLLSASLDAYQKQEQAEGRLRAAMKLTGDATDAQFAAMKRYASELQSVTTVGDETILEIMTLGSSLGKLAGEDLKAATVAAIGLSKATGSELNSAMKAIAKGAQGSFDTFGELGISFDENATNAEKMAQVLQQGVAGFEIAKAEAATASGGIEQFRNAIGDLSEEIGGSFAPHLREMADWLRQNMTRVSGWIEKFAGFVGQVFEGFTVLLDLGRFAWENWGDVLELSIVKGQLALASLWEDIKHFFTNTIPTVLKWFAENWRDIFTDTFNFGKTVVANYIENVVTLIKNLPKLIKGETSLGEIWTPLTDGFEATLTTLPDIVDRELTYTEKSLAARSDRLGKKIREEFINALAGAAPGAGPAGPSGPNMPQIPVLPGGAGGGDDLVDEVAAAIGGGAGRAAGGRRGLSARVGNLITRAPGTRGGAEEVLRRMEKQGKDDSRVLKEMRDSLDEIERGRIVALEA